jgi:cytidine deaminase
MIAAGDRNPIACAIVTAGPTPAPPCGICRQVLVEFARDMPIVLVGLDGKKTIRRDLELRALMPEVFELPPR